MAIKILIVEDHMDSQELMGLVLRRLGYNVIEAATGLEAFDKAQKSHPSLILIDLGLPGITGDEVIARLKADPSTRDIPIVVTTAFHNEAPMVLRARAAGAAYVVQKPLIYSDLKETVQ